MTDEEPKLIIDEDWKTQVQREKEEAKRQTSPPAEHESSDYAGEMEAAELGSEPDGPVPPPPPASLMLLVSTLAAQALASMGQMPDEDGKPPMANLPYAKHFIDLLGVLEEKTKGNLTDQEKSQIGDALHQLRILYVTLSKQQP
ncbi:MAG: DUF1844 domain-containing protein [Planctomycetales bacterium]|nr:DUF1844 domain-containing protein [Planctomycetales bacterium]